MYRYFSDHELMLVRKMINNRNLDRVFSEQLLTIVNEKAKMDDMSCMDVFMELEKQRLEDSMIEGVNDEVFVESQGKVILKEDFLNGIEDDQHRLMMTTMVNSSRTMVRIISAYEWFFGDATTLSPFLRKERTRFLNSKSHRMNWMKNHNFGSVDDIDECMKILKADAIKRKLIDA